MTTLKTPYHTATHELVGTCGNILYIGSAGDCFRAMVNIYGDGRVVDMVRAGAQVRKL